MSRKLCPVLGACAMLALAPESAGAELLVLDPVQMDRITAGAVGAVVDSAAGATGSFNLSDTASTAVATAEEGSHPSITSTGGAGAGTAVAIGAGGNASTDTSVSTAGAAEGTFIVGRSYGWTIRVLAGQASGGMVWVSGRTGAFLLGGP